VEETIEPITRSDPAPATPIPWRAETTGSLPRRVFLLEAAFLVAAACAIGAFVVRLAGGPFDWRLGPISLSVEYPSAPAGLALGFFTGAAVTWLRAARHEDFVRLPSLGLTLASIAAVPIPELKKIGLSVAYAIFLLWLIEGVVTRSWPFRRTRLDVPIALFLGTQIAAALLAEDRRDGLDEFLQSTLPPVVILYSAHEHAVRRERVAAALAGAVALSSAMLLAVGFHRYFTTDEPFFIANLGWYTRAGRFFNLALPLLAVAALRAKGLRIRLGASALAIASLVALVLTQSRGAWAGAVASFVFLGAVLDRRLLLGVAAALLVAIAVAPKRLLDHARSMFEFARYGESTVESPLKYRPAAWRFAVDAIAERPIFGHGAGASGFRERFEREMSPPPNNGIANAHNVFLQIAYESGLVGLGAFLLLLLATYFLGLGTRARPGPGRIPFAIMALASLTGVLVHGLVSHVTHDGLATLFYLQFAFVLLASPAPGSPKPE